MGEIKDVIIKTMISI